MGYVIRDDHGAIKLYLSNASPSFPDAEPIDGDGSEVAAFLASAAPPAIPDISRRQFFEQLAIDSIITHDDALAAACMSTIPAPLTDAITRLPADQRFNATMRVASATTFRRSSAVTIALASAMDPPWSSDQVDALWTAAFTL